jgi:hypothetical protein
VGAPALLNHTPVGLVAVHSDLHTAASGSDGVIAAIGRQFFQHILRRKKFFACIGEESSGTALTVNAIHGAGFEWDKVDSQRAAQTAGRYRTEDGSVFTAGHHQIKLLKNVMKMVKSLCILTGKVLY